jgi:hypothetical protein
VASAPAWKMVVTAVAGRTVAKRAMSGIAQRIMREIVLGAAGLSILSVRGSGRTLTRAFGAWEFALTVSWAFDPGYVESDRWPENPPPVFSRIGGNTVSEKRWMRPFGLGSKSMLTILSCDLLSIKGLAIYSGDLFESRRRNSSHHRSAW